MRRCVQQCPFILVRIIATTSLLAACSKGALEDPTPIPTSPVAATGAAESPWPSEIRVERFGPAGGTVLNVLFDPAEAETLYATTFGRLGSLWRSRDGGLTWDLLLMGFDHEPNAAYVNWKCLLDLSRTLPTVLTAAGCDSRGLLRSFDGGETWLSRQEGLPINEQNVPLITAIQSAPENADVLYAVTKNRLFTSRDGGQSWEDLDVLAQSITVLDSDWVSRLWCPSSGLACECYQSKDAGRSWTPHQCLGAQNPTQPTSLFTGYALSLDGGESWEQILDSAERGFDLVEDPSWSNMEDRTGWYVWTKGFSGSQPSELFLGLKKGRKHLLCTRPTAGGVWKVEEVETCLDERVQSPHQAGRYANFSHPRGIEICDGDELQQHQGQPYMEDEWFGSIAWTELAPERFFYAGQGELLRSDDSGQSWAPIEASSGLCYKPGSSDSIVNHSLELSQDGGLTWQETPWGSSFNSFSSPEVYWGSNGIYFINKSLTFSDDLGQSWQTLNTGFDISHIYPHPADPNYLILTHEEGLSLFDQSTMNVVESFSLGVAPSRFAGHENLWILRFREGLLVKDGKKDWEEVAAFEGKRVMALVVDPDLPNYVLVGLSDLLVTNDGHGLYLSTDRAHSFQPIEFDGLELSNITDIVVDSTRPGSYYIAAQSGRGGLYHLSLVP